MKHQYVGDINDYVKYGLLRELTAHGQISATVAWMLTPDDHSRDGRKLGYLTTPQNWRHRDPELFDALSQIVAHGQRCVTAVEASNVLPATRFHSELVPRAIEDRRAHFGRTLAIAAGSDLIFFDPDNGLEVGSCPPGRRGSEKYLLWEELVAAYRAGKSVLIYQHFPRQEREAFIWSISQRIGARTGACEIQAFRTSNVVFLLVPQHHATEWYIDRMDAVDQHWHGVIKSEVVAVE